MGNNRPTSDAEASNQSEYLGLLDLKSRAAELRGLEEMGQGRGEEDRNWIIVQMWRH